MKEKTKLITKTICFALSAILVFCAAFFLNAAISDASLKQATKLEGDYSALFKDGVKLLSEVVSTPDPQANESAYLLTATITPATASCALDWSVAWQDGNSAWANGKSVTEYVTITPTSDGALTANVACLKAFAEPIVIKAVVRNDADVYATCVVDYQSRNTWLNFELVSSKYPAVNVDLGMDQEEDVVELVLPAGSEAQKSFFVNDLTENSDYLIQNTINASGLYTVLDTIESYSIGMKPSQQFLTAANEVGLSCSLSAEEYVTLNRLRYGEIIEKLTNNSIFGEGYFVDGIYEQFIAACQKTATIDFGLKITTVCKSGRTNEYVLTCHFAHSNFPAVENVALNPDHILF